MKRAYLRITYPDNIKLGWHQLHAMLLRELKLDRKELRTSFVHENGGKPLHVSVLEYSEKFMGQIEQGSNMRAESTINTYNKEDAIKQYAKLTQAAMFPEEKPQHTYYCLFLPLGIYCGFGAENIHHAYNKAAKYWGARNQIGRPYDDMPQSIVHRDLRISVSEKESDFIGCNNPGKYKQVSHTLMTKLVKAWREENG